MPTSALFGLSEFDVNSGGDAFFEGGDGVACDAFDDTPVDTVEDVADDGEMLDWGAFATVDVEAMLFIAWLVKLLLLAESESLVSAAGPLRCWFIGLAVMVDALPADAVALLPWSEALVPNTLCFIE